jgi:hypothetical protein
MTFSMTSRASAFTSPAAKASSVFFNEMMPTITGIAGSLSRGSFSIVLLLLFSESVAWGYRPFIATDAAVADPKELEIEFGYFTLERDRGKNTFIIPKVVLNYGLIRNLEVVTEFGIAEPPHGSVRLSDAGFSLKAVLKEGVLQEKPGVSFAVEAGPLLPSTGRERGKVGFEAVGIISGELSPVMFHLNLGGGIDRMENNPFVIWGLIAELPVVPKFRVVGEIDGENTKGRSADTSALLGFIWAPLSNLSVDAGIRRGISRAAADWMFTTGLTFGFFFH